MLNFNAKGLLMPDTSINASLEELKIHFVDDIPSQTRLANFEKYIHYSNELKKLIQTDRLRQWINGSFVTKTIANPKDIDLVTFIDFETWIKFREPLKDFEAEKANKIYGVDAYLLTEFPKEHTSAFLFESDKAYWMGHFSKTRRDRSGQKHPKGFLEIIY